MDISEELISKKEVIGYVVFDLKEKIKLLEKCGKINTYFWGGYIQQTIDHR